VRTGTSLVTSLPRELAGGGVIAGAIKRVFNRGVGIPPIVVTHLGR